MASAQPGRPDNLTWPLAGILLALVIALGAYAPGWWGAHREWSAARAERESERQDNLKHRGVDDWLKATEERVVAAEGLAMQAHLVGGLLVVPAVIVVVVLVGRVRRRRRRRGAEGQGRVRDRGAEPKG